MSSREGDSLVGETDFDQVLGVMKENGVPRNV